MMFKITTKMPNITQLCIYLSSRRRTSGFWRLQPLVISYILLCITIADVQWFRYGYQLHWLAEGFWFGVSSIRPAVWQIMKVYGIPEEIIDIVKCLYNNTIAAFNYVPCSGGKEGRNKKEHVPREALCRGGIWRDEDNGILEIGRWRREQTS